MMEPAGHRRPYSGMSLDRTDCRRHPDSRQKFRGCHDGWSMVSVRTVYTLSDRARCEIITPLLHYPGQEEGRKNDRRLPLPTTAPKTHAEDLEEEKSVALYVRNVVITRRLHFQHAGHPASHAK